MRARRLLSGFIAAFCPAFGLAVGSMVSVSGVNQGSAFTELGATYFVNQGHGVDMILGQRHAAFGLALSGADFSAYTHLLLTVTNHNSSPTMIEVGFDSGINGWAWADFIIGGDKTEDVMVPLQASTLGGWGGGIASSVSTDNQAVFFGSLVKNNVTRVRIINPMRNSTQNLTLVQMTPETLAIPTTSVIDQYGQQSLSFPGKVTSDIQLIAQAAVDAQLSGQLPYSSDAYGGVAGSGSGSATGKWHVAKQNGKWYIITPSGNRFFSTGIDCVGNGSLAFTQGRSSLFSPGALPTFGSPSYQFLYNVTNPYTGAADQGYDFYQANLKRKYGSNWASMSDSVSANRLRTWGFNTVGPSSQSTLYNNPSLQLANTQQTAITGNFQSVPCQSAVSMPDPYDPAWATSVSSTLTPLVSKMRSDAYNMGLFVDNELPWAQNWQSANYSYDLAFNVLSAPANQPAKQRFYRSLLMKYRTIQKLNSAWGQHYNSWSDLLANRAFRPATPSVAMTIDMKAFITAFANQYFSIIRAKLKALNYPGLYLGCRFAYYSPEVVASAAHYCDVVSVNAYDLTPTQWHTDLKALNAPVLISEFGFAAADQGRAGGFSPCALTEDDRVEAYQEYVADASTWSNLVGLHWYKWEDEPVTGRMWDDSNQTLGFVSIADQPYQQLVDAATQINASLNSRLVNP